MKTHSLASLTIGLLLMATSAFAQPPETKWIKIADQLSFSPRDSCGELVYQDRLWLLGGWVDSFKDPPRDVWSSGNGKDWVRATNEAAWKHSDFPMTLSFKNRMWVMGGWHGGRLPHATASNTVWSSDDGANWKQETAAAGWSPRMAAGAVVFKDRMWILGGVQKYYFGDDNDLRNDVWSSSDGVNWELATTTAPWPPRAYLGSVAFAGKIWVLGGGNYLPNYRAYHDVWSSSDGVEWTQESDGANWSGRIWFSTEVYRDRMWILGGWSNNPAKNWNDVWHSQDGKLWTEFKTDSIWTPRHEHSTYVFQDKLWVIGGHAAPLNNEVWQMFLPKQWPK